MEWEKPNNFFAILRCSNVKYANDLINSGTIMFNCARVWADMERKSGQGQGDLHEGIFASCHPLEIDSVLSYMQQYDDVESEFDGKLVHFKRKSVMEMPAYCFYMLKQSLFNCSGKEGIQTLTAEIPGRYFQDFAAKMTKEQVMALDEEKRPALVAISDSDKFINMVKSKLISMGIKESEILVQVITYIDKQNPFYSLLESPRELFIKDNSFSYQSEGRIVINTRNKSLINRLVGIPIEIGSIKEFSQKSDTYLEQGVLIQMTADVYKIEDEGE